jgi:hypothetical protein
MLQVGEWPLELIIVLLEFLKFDFGEVNEGMFQGVARPCKLIVCILVIEKCDLDEFA